MENGLKFHTLKEKENRQPPANPSYLPLYQFGALTANRLRVVCNLQDPVVYYTVFRDDPLRMGGS
jgi:hypothetical protein